ncbi:hypothetical protein ACSSVY_001131 [Roseovarius sp. MBR-51]
MQNEAKRSSNLDGLSMARALPRLPTTIDPENPQIKQTDFVNDVQPMGSPIGWSN